MGALAQSRQTGLRPTNAIDALEETPFLNRILRLTLTAIIASGISLQSFSIMAGLFYEGLPPEYLRLPQPYTDYCKRLPPTLESLTLAVSPSAYTGSSDTWASDLLGLLEILPNTTELELWLRTRSLHDASCITNLARRLWLPRLRTLRLVGSYCSLRVLGVIFFKHKDILEQISLIGIVTPDSIQGWKNLLVALRTHSSVCRLSICSCRARGGRICSRELGRGGEEYTDSISLSGTQEDWIHAVQRIVEKAD